MKIGRFEITSDKFNWILIEHYDGRDKQGNDKQQSRETYHGTLQQCCQEMIQREAKHADDLESLLATIQQSTNIIAHACEGIKKEQAA